MNKVFKVIYNEARNCCVVVSELAKCHSKGRHARHRIRYGGCKGNRIFHSSRKGKAILAVLMAAGTLSFPVCGQAAFTGVPGTYSDFVKYKGSLYHDGTSEYTFEKGAQLDGSNQEDAFSVSDSSQDMTIHVGKADGKHYDYDFEVAGYNRSFRNVEGGHLTIDDKIDGQSTGADYHFYNNAKSRDKEDGKSVKTLFFAENSTTSISGHSVTIDSINNNTSSESPKMDSHGILIQDARSVSFDMTGDFNLDNEQRGIHMDQKEQDGSIAIQAKNINVTCKEPNENLDYYSVGVYAYGYPSRAILTMKAEEDLNVNGYSTALQGMGYVNMSLSGGNITLDGNPSVDGFRSVFLNGASTEDSRISLTADNTLKLIGGTGEEAYGIKDISGDVTGIAQNISVSGATAALYSRYDGAIHLNADNQIVDGKVMAVDGSTVSFDGKNQDGNGIVKIQHAGATGVLAGVEKTLDDYGNYFDPANVNIKQNAIINVHSDLNDLTYQDKDFADTDASALAALTDGKITVDKAQGIYGNITADIDDAIDAKQAADLSAGTIDLMTAEGGEIKGNASAGHGGTVNLTLAKGDWEGRATDYQGTDAAGTLNLTMQDGSIWHMKGDGDSNLTSLANTSSLVDMKANSKYQTLNIGTFSGQNGTFLMKTDLDSQTDGDKIKITDAAKGSQGRVQVYDKSFLTGKEVTGAKHLLLITDESRNAAFSGQFLDKGGLWDVTPTIERGDTVKDASGKTVGDATQWYLTKLEKSINKDTKPLLGAADYAYGSYRMDIETLRQRMGELRFLKDKQDESGIWARMYGGEFDGPGYDSRYHALQLGYDYAANPKSFYGWFGERGIASPHYDYGTSSNHSLAAGIYGTWFGDSGVYTDAVAKWGRDDVNLHTSGSYPDQANYRTRAASLSLEYGKTMKLNDKGVFLEPQAQLVYGHLGSTHYTTAREKQVHMDDYDSFIGRVGFVFGRRTPDATKPLDYYLRLSALHEFGGRRDMHFSASDGETMDWSRDYGSTWYEASLGGTYRLNDRTTLYGDVQRSFGSDWHKKWQGNIGINWQF